MSFSPGPAVLPLPVLEEAQRDLVSLPGIGISVLEISHRSPAFADILGEAEENLRRLLRIPDHYRVLFLQGGARLQFSMVPINFLRGGGPSADYILTGSWGEKAVQEAAREGDTRLAWNGKEEGFTRVPATGELDLDPRAAYVHLTSNETIQGVQFAEMPEVGDAPLVCDASSDFLSRPLDVERFALLYACAQKNAGPAGLTLVVVRDDFLDQRAAGIHSMLDYGQHAASGSVFNTPPVFAIYVFLLVSRWIEREFGDLEGLHRHNREKAALLYDVLDAHGDFYRGHADPASRSFMNVTFRLPGEELETAFLAAAGEAGLHELKGHRSVGGIRASIYNAMPREGVERLAELMQRFREEQG